MSMLLSLSGESALTLEEGCETGQLLPPFLSPFIHAGTCEDLPYV